MGVAGDFAALAKIRGQVARLPVRGKERILQACAQEGRLLVEQGFEAGRAPSGAPWAPVRRGGQPLRDTGRLLASLTPRVTGGGFVIETTVRYADVHQRGATIASKKKGRSLGTPKAGWFGVRVTIPARPFLPEDGLPGAWEVRLVEAASDALQVLFR